MTKRTRDRAIGWAALGVVAAGLISAAGTLMTGAHFARRVLTPAKRPDAQVTVEAIAQGPNGERVVWLKGPDVALAGSYSFIFDDGASHARLGPVVTFRAGARGRECVAREIIAENHGRLRVGARGRITGWWYTDPAELGFSTRHIEIPLEAGQAPAWVIAPREADHRPGYWAIHVHGRGALRHETLRGVAPFARAGLTNLIVSYRNDPGAPEGERGRYGMGLAEQRDVQAAIAWARSQGAEHVTLVGWSMGGTICVLAAAREAKWGGDAINGLVLDSPALDWPSLLRTQARLARAPGWVAALGQMLMQRGIIAGAVPDQRATDISALTAEALAAELHVPVLIHAGPEDTFVPWAGAVRFAELRPDLVTLREAPGEHVKHWNADPDAWESATETFLRELTDRTRPTIAGETRAARAYGAEPVRTTASGSP